MATEPRPQSAPYQALQLLVSQFLLSPFPVRWRRQIGVSDLALLAVKQRRQSIKNSIGITVKGGGCYDKGSAWGYGRTLGVASRLRGWREGELLLTQGKHMDTSYQKSVMEGRRGWAGLEGVNLLLSVLGHQWWGFCGFSFEENVCRGAPGSKSTSLMVLSQRRSKADSDKDLKRAKIGARQEDQLPKLP